MVTLDLTPLQLIKQFFLPGWVNNKSGRNNVNIALGDLFHQIMNVTPQLQRARGLLDNENFNFKFSDFFTARFWKLFSNLRTYEFLIGCAFIVCTIIFVICTLCLINLIIPCLLAVIEICTKCGFQCNCTACWSCLCCPCVQCFNLLKLCCLGAACWCCPRLRRAEEPPAPPTRHHTVRALQHEEDYPLHRLQLRPGPDPLQRLRALRSDQERRFEEL